MKKIYLIGAFLGLVSMAFSQERLSQETIQSLSQSKTVQTNDLLLNTGQYTPNANDDKTINEDVHAKSGEFFDGDFNDATQWIVDPSPIAGVNWTFIGDPSWGYNLGNGALIIDPITTTPGEKFAAFDMLTGPQTFVGQGGWLQINQTFDFSTESQITLSFDQSYAGLNYDSTFVQYSKDNGLTWTNIQINGSAPANTPITTSENLVIDTDNSTQFLVRFYYKCLEKIGAQPTQQGGYVWQLYNVKVSKVTDNDIAIKTGLLTGFGSGDLSTFDQIFSNDPSIYGIGEDLFRYNQIPESQLQEVNSMIQLKNNGKLDQTNIQLNAEETNAGYSATSTATSIVSGADDILKVDNGFTPSGQGNYNIEYGITADATDDIPSNNQVDNYEFKVGQYTYAMDNAGDAAKDNTTLNNAWGASDEPIEVGVLYEIVNEVEITGIDIKFGFNNPTDGSQVWGVIYSDGGKVMNQEDPAYLTETEMYDVDTADAGKYVTLKFDEPVTLTPGLYLISAKSYDLNFSIAGAGATNYYNTFIYGALAATSTDELWFVLGEQNAPVVRMNFDPTLGVEKDELNTLDVTQFPNPFANETTVRFSLEKASNVSYTITDMTGKVIADVNEGNLTTGDHEITVNGSSLANGIYYLNLKTDNAQVTRKMVVNK